MKSLVIATTLATLAFGGAAFANDSDNVVGVPVNQPTRVEPIDAGQQFGSPRLDGLQTNSIQPDPAPTMPEASPFYTPSHER